MIIRINGKDETIDRPKNITELIAGKGLVPEHIVVEHNSRIAPKNEWHDIRLKENDNVEIISFVGGG